MRLTRSMSEKQEESETTVFRECFSRAMEIQEQLDDGYQGDRYLRDRLKEAVDIPEIQSFLKERPARKAQQLINRVANRLSDRPRTAGAVYASWDIQKDHKTGDVVLYSLGKQYHGGARRVHRGFGMCGRRGRQPVARNTRDRNDESLNKRAIDSNRTQEEKQNTGLTREMRPSWMHGIEGYYVCGKPQSLQKSAKGGINGSNQQTHT